MFANPADTSSLPSLLTSNNKISVVEMQMENLWMRDTGPVFVVAREGGVKGIDFGFNYWGAKFPQKEDIGLARRILNHIGVERVDAQLCTEGGALEIDGEGTLLATESSLINPNRNPGMSKEQVEEILKSALGIQKVLWFKGVKDEDSTDCHIDALARFLEPGRVLLSKPHGSRKDIWMEVYEDARKVLEKEKDANGRAFHVIDLPEPDLDQLEGGDEEDMVASYVNYYLANGAVIVPCFGDERADRRCAEVFRELFPGRELVQVKINILPRTGGGIHCATQQQPIV